MEIYKIIIINKNNKQCLTVKHASNFIKRLKGLINKTEIKQGLIFIQKNKTSRYLASIHTHFMKETIDIIFLDNNKKIQDITTLKPWKIYTPKKGNIKYILELPQNTIKNNNITNNTIIEIKKKQ